MYKPAKTHAGVSEIGHGFQTCSDITAFRPVDLQVVMEAVQSPVSFGFDAQMHALIFSAL